MANVSNYFHHKRDILGTRLYAVRSVTAPPGGNKRSYRTYLETRTRYEKKRMQKTPFTYESRLTFRQQVHQPRIYAGAPAGVYVATVHAYDPDKPRKKVEYSLNNILDYKQFQVDKFSGNLSTALPVNKSVGEFYQVMVTAKTPGSSDLEHLEILVTEFNQFAPRFDHDRYTIQMHPRAKVGTVVLKVHATDRDNESHNSETYYLLDQNKTSQYFTLDSKKGELKLSQPITTNEPLQDFGIYAEDGGSPKRWAYVPVSIVMRALSEPRNVTIENVQHHEAKICWDPPEFGSIYGYTIKYYPFGSEGYFTFNTSSINKFGRMCENLTMLFDNVNYNLEIVGWNSRGEFGVKTEIFEFHTPEDFCKQKCAHGTCKELNREPWYECECPSGYSGQFCQAFDACSLHPCKNNGTCRNTNDNGYICICDGNYSGPSCGSFNPCLKSNPCENSGICEMTTNNTLICICAEGFYGRRCKYRDPCYNISCFNGGTCQVTGNGSYSCTCRNGFTGTHCETEIDECEKNPCSNGSTCLSKDGYFVCLCLDGFSGQTCEELEQCPSERTETDKGNFFWNSTNHSTEVSLRCPFGSLQSLPEAYAYRYCSLYEGFAVWGSVNASDCKTMEFLVADEVADELHSITKDPVSLNQETLEAASQGLSTISSFAAKDKKVAEGMVKVISNIMEVNDSIVVEDKNNSFTKLSENLLQVVDTLASNMELKPGESMTVNAPNVRVHSIEWNPEEGNDTNFNHIQLSAPKDRPSPSTDKQTSIFITDSPETVTPEYPVTTRSPEKPKVPVQ
ncbi:hypothetical protein CDAR_464701 [Caerostris darwini]|uniref:Uncharacterized protein n=1 Tax=Caerostris darwini TaxID=1538125 RepID=A0AAV4Q5S5_9ARAC|nr:hypothetical protein CDAR_464701 [Caerostris darwini]